jgi:hypothetical protein
MNSPQNMLVEVYQGRDTKLGFICQTPEDVRHYLQPLLEEKYIQPVIDELLRQRQNPEAFPNIVLCLDSNNDTIHIEEYIRQWKAARKPNSINSTST